MKVAILSCTKKKAKQMCKARDLYSPSPLFRLGLQYVESLNFDAIYIVSTKYHLLDLNEVIEPYDLTLKDMDKSAKAAWAVETATMIRKQIPKEAEIHFFTGKVYKERLAKVLKNEYKIVEPLQGLKSIGFILSFYKTHIKEVA